MLFITVLVGILTTTSLACPFWVGIASQSSLCCNGRNADDGACGRQNNSTHERHKPCPMSICQASSPYLADGLKHDLLVLDTVGTEVVEFTVVPTRLEFARYHQRDETSPPGTTGPRFLKTHTLLI